MAGKPPTLERTLAEMRRWPASWEIDGDRDAGAALVAGFTPFVLQLYATGAATTTLRRHLGNLWQLGGEVIRRRHAEAPPAPVPPLTGIVDQEGGPLLHGQDEDEQRSFDATCRALHRFLITSAGRAVNPTRKERTPVADAANGEP